MNVASLVLVGVFSLFSKQRQQVMQGHWMNDDLRMIFTCKYADPC